MKLNTIAPQKSRAQAMVEFAIVLPLLLLLLYGLLETGRLLFMYSTIVTATRQASRYGSATGEGTTPGIPRYQDCAGIRQAANRVDFLNAFDHEGVDVQISWDDGPTDPDGPSAICPPGSASEDWTPTDNDNRLIVTVTGHFNPIVPRIVPFIARTIEAMSARTIITGVSIEVTSPAGGGPPPAGTTPLTISMNATPQTYGRAGETIQFLYTVVNSGSTEVTGISLITTHGSYFNCTATSLAVGGSMTCEGSYQITDTDVTNGSISAQARAVGSDGTNSVESNTVTVPLTWVAQPQLQLAKTASTEYASTGGAIQYTFTLTNAGNVTLTSLTVSDPTLGVTGLSCASELAPSASTSCVANYTVTESDVSNSRINNTATASALYGSQTVTSNESSVIVWTGPLFLRASASPVSVDAAGQTITYTYEFINNTGVVVYPPYALSGYRGTENCSAQTGTIPVGGSITCTGTYTVTQTDLNQNSSLNNDSIRATACSESNNGNCPASRRVNSNTRSVRVTLVRNPALSLGELNATYTSPIALGTVITYSYPVRNIGNVVLTPSITDTKVTGITCPAIEPNVTQSCSGSYTVTQEDLDAGSITNQATATATFDSQSVSSTSQSFRVFTFEGPRLSLQITPNPTSFTGVGEFIVYTYTIRNTGSVPLTADYVITDNKVTSVDCTGATSPLDIGGSTTCVGSYATTQADVAAGHIINSASARAYYADKTQTTISNSAMAVVYVPGAPTLTPSPTNTGVPTATRTPTPTQTPTPTRTPRP